MATLEIYFGDGVFVDKKLPTAWETSLGQRMTGLTAQKMNQMDFLELMGFLPKELLLKILLGRDLLKGKTANPVTPRQHLIKDCGWSNDGPGTGWRSRGTWLPTIWTPEPLKIGGSKWEGEHECVGALPIEVPNKWQVGTGRWKPDTKFEFQRNPDGLRKGYRHLIRRTEENWKRALITSLPFRDADEERSWAVLKTNKKRVTICPVALAPCGGRGFVFDKKISVSYKKGCLMLLGLDVKAKLTKDPYSVALRDDARIEDILELGYSAKNEKRATGESWNATKKRIALTCWRGSVATHSEIAFMEEVGFTGSTHPYGEWYGSFGLATRHGQR